MVSFKRFSALAFTSCRSGLRIFGCTDVFIVNYIVVSCGKVDVCSVVQSATQIRTCILFCKEMNDRAIVVFVPKQL